MKLKMIAAAVLATAALSANAGGLLGNMTSASVAGGVVTPAAQIVVPVAGGFTNPAPATTSPLGSMSSANVANGVVTPAPKVAGPAIAGNLVK